LRDENKGAATEKYRCCSFFLISMKNINEKYQRKISAKNISEK